ncbi:MAG: hypothetical protein LBM03_00305 [Erysipelotrichaceae bacterium]|nr:hypothetical protein [Erysipelotrichaceae bacterium]
MKKVFKLSALLLIGGLTACGTTNSSSGTGTSDTSTSDIPPVVEPDYTVDKSVAIDIIAASYVKQMMEILPSYDAYRIDREYTQNMESVSSEYALVYAFDLNAKQFYYSSVDSYTEGNSTSESYISEYWAYVKENITYDVQNNNGIKTYDYAEGDMFESYASNYANIPEQMVASDIQFNSSFAIALLSESEDLVGYEITSESFESTGDGNLVMELVMNVSEDVTGYPGGISDVTLNLSYDNYRISLYEFVYAVSEQSISDKMSIDYYESGIVLPDLSDYHNNSEESVVSE